MAGPLTGPLAGPRAPAPAVANPAERAQMQKVARQFEAVFMRQMIGAMRQANLAEGAFDSSATDQFRDMADSRTADAMANMGGLGVADLLMKQYDQKNKVVTPPAVDGGE